MVLSSWLRAIVSVHGVHLTTAECRLGAVWPPTLRPSQPTWAVSPPIKIGSCHLHPSSPFIIITQPES